MSKGCWCSWHCAGAWHPPDHSYLAAEQHPCKVFLSCVVVGKGCAWEEACTGELVLHGEMVPRMEPCG